jgi:hypothetical protein
MSVQNPTLPIPTALKGIDATVADLQTHLSFELAWLTNGMGRAYRIKKVRSNGATQFLPLVYLGTSTYDYFDASPDNDKEGQSIILVGDGTYPNQQQGFYGIIEYPVSLIFSANLKTINSTLLLTEMFTEHLMENVREALLRDTLGKAYKINIESETIDFDTVYSEFDINTDAGKTNKPLAPMTYFRFDLTMQIKESCPPASLDRCTAILQNLSDNDKNTCIWPTIDLSNSVVQANATAQQIIDGTAWLCAGPGAYVNNYSMRYDGINQDLSTTYNAAFDFDRLDGFTFQSRLVRNSTDFYMFGKLLALRGFIVRIQNSQLWIYFINTLNTNELRVRSAVNVPAIGTPFHWAITKTAGVAGFASIKMYINGAAVGTALEIDNLLGTTKSIATLTTGSAIGSYAAGDMNVARIHNVELSAAQVLTEYSGGTPDFPILPLNLVYGSDQGDGAVFGTDTWCLPDTSGTTTGQQSANMNFASRIAAI